MRNTFMPALVILAAFTLLTGVLYPLVVTGVVQVAFPSQAQGSLIREGDRILGSELIGQPFSDPRHFWSRPSATAPVPYNGAASSGSNLGPSNPALHDAVGQRVAALRAADPGNTQPVPIDLVTASGSGLDPHISVAAARYQIPRVARERGLQGRVAEIERMIDEHTQQRFAGALGEPCVNVLLLNRALDTLGANAGRP